MRIDFRGFALDCTIEGEVELRAERLKDQLDQDDRLVVMEVALRGLDDGRVVRLPRLELDRREILAAVGVPPRGPHERRIRTVRHRVAVTVGPYTVSGDLHEKPGTPPMGAFHTSRPIASLTHATITYVRAGQRETQRADTILVNRDRVDWLGPGINEDMPLTTNAVVPSRQALHTPEVG